jgi:ubiquinone/menaquinone biosynthesis C-methylase UbiE
MSGASPLPDYVLGRTPEEYARLSLQARIVRPYTERYFRAAGLGPGMRVLELGSGVGEVAVIAADLVGADGHVHGVDVDAQALVYARRRIAQHGCAATVTFEAASIDEYQTTDQFDALVGRYVLLYLPDPVAAIRRLLSNVKPGGIVVFHDVDFSDPQPSHPPCALWDQGYQLVREAFERAGTPLTFGTRLGDTFVRAGLPFPALVSEGGIGGGPGSPLYAWLATVVTSVAPRLKGLA